MVALNLALFQHRTSRRLYPPLPGRPTSPSGLSLEGLNPVDDFFTLSGLGEESRLEGWVDKRVEDATWGGTTVDDSAAVSGTASDSESSWGPSRERLYEWEQVDEGGDGHGDDCNGVANARFGVGTV